MFEVGEIWSSRAQQNPSFTESSMITTDQPLVQFDEDIHVSEPDSQSIEPPELDDKTISPRLVAETPSSKAATWHRLYRRVKGENLVLQREIEEQEKELEMLRRKLKYCQSRLEGYSRMKEKVKNLKTVKMQLVQEKLKHESDEVKRQVEDDLAKRSMARLDRVNAKKAKILSAKEGKEGIAGSSSGIALNPLRVNGGRPDSPMVKMVNGSTTDLLTHRSVILRTHNPMSATLYDPDVARCHVDEAAPDMHAL